MGHGKIKIGSMAFSASQIGTLYGCGWNTMLELYNKYKGINAVLQEPSEEAKESMEFGSFFEEPVAQFFAKKMGFKIKRCGETAYWKNDMPYFICHPDRLVIGRDEQGRRVGIEVKCVSPYSEGWGESGTTEIPDVYYFQVQGYFACGVPCDVVYVVCMRGNRIYVYEILPDEEVIADIRYRVAKTKKDFDAGIIPEPVNYKEALNLYRQKVDMDAEGIGANDEVMEKYNRLLQIHEQKDRLDADEEKIKQELMASLGEAPAYLMTEGKKIRKIAYWSNGSNSSYDEDRLKKDFPKLNLADYKVTTTYKKFNIGYPRKKKEAV